MCCVVVCGFVFGRIINISIIVEINIVLGFVCAVFHEIIFSCWNVSVDDLKFVVVGRLKYL